MSKVDYEIVSKLHDVFPLSQIQISPGSGDMSSLKRLQLRLSNYLGILQGAP